MIRECEREREVFETARSGRWPEGCGDELRAHIASCEPCAALVELAGTLAGEYHEAMKTAPVPPAGLVWWRAQRRARQEASRAAMKTATAIQAVTIVAAVLALVLIVAWSGWLTHLPWQWAVPLLAALAASALLAPVAVYVAVARHT